MDKSIVGVIVGAAILGAGYVIAKLAGINSIPDLFGNHTHCDGDLYDCDDLEEED